MARLSFHLVFVTRISWICELVFMLRTSNSLFLIDCSCKNFAEVHLMNSRCCWSRRTQFSIVAWAYSTPSVTFLVMQRESFAKVIRDRCFKRPRKFAWCVVSHVRRSLHISTICSRLVVLWFVLRTKRFIESLALNSKTSVLRRLYKFDWAATRNFFGLTTFGLSRLYQINYFTRNLLIELALCLITPWIRTFSLLLLLKYFYFFVEIY